MLGPCGLNERWNEIGFLDKLFVGWDRFAIENGSSSRMGCVGGFFRHEPFGDQLRGGHAVHIGGKVVLSCDDLLNAG